MPKKEYGKPSKLKREKLEGKKPSGDPSENPESPGKTEHPVMETHPGAREKPKPVRKPRARKSTTPAPVAEAGGDAPTTPAVSTDSGDKLTAHILPLPDDKPLTWTEAPTGENPS